MIIIISGPVLCYGFAGAAGLTMIYMGYRTLSESLKTILQNWRRQWKAEICIILGFAIFGFAFVQLMFMK